jgi:hypothetical protein
MPAPPWKHETIFVVFNVKFHVFLTCVFDQTNQKYRQKHMSNMFYEKVEGEKQFHEFFEIRFVFAFLAFSLHQEDLKNTI